MTEQGDGTAAAVDPIEFANQLANTPDEQIAAGMNSEARGMVLGEIFKRMGDYLKPEAAQNVDAVVHWKITERADGGFDHYELVIKDGKATVTDNPQQRGARDLLGRGRGLPQARDRQRQRPDHVHHRKAQNHRRPSVRRADRRPLQGAHMSATEEAAAAAAADLAQGEPPPFTLALSDDQRDIRDWVHGFAEGVVRPAVAEWDEREETPWPIIQEAAKIGLYGFESLAQFWADPSGITLALANEELFWGDAGIGMSIMGSSLAAAGIFSAGTPEQLMEWVPQCYGTPDDVKVGSFCVSEPDAGSDVSSLRTTAKYDEAKDEWVLNGQKAWATNGGIANVHVIVASVDRELGSRGQAAFVVPPGTKGLEQGTKVKKHGIRASHTADVHLDDCRVPGACLLGGKEKLDERLARAREGTRS